MPWRHEGLLGTKLPTPTIQKTERETCPLSGEPVVLKTNEHPLGLLLLKQRSRLESVLESKQKLFVL